jgi:plastocyanin
MDSKIAVAVGLAAVLAALVTSISIPTPAYAAEVAVSITQGSSSKTTNAYSPNPIEINVGDTVIWTNNDPPTTHTATSGTPSAGPDGKFGGTPDAPFSELISPGRTFSFTFNEAGEFPYYCTLHPNMVGTVMVSEGGGNGGTEPQEFTITATDADRPYQITGKSATSKATEATIQPGQSVTIRFDKAGDVELTLPKSMISGINSVKAGNQELLQGDPTVNADGSSTISITIPEGSATVVITGEKVVPEFPVIAAILAAAIAGIIGYTRFARSGTGFFGRA